MRLFAAVLPPDDVLQDLADAVAPLRELPAGQRLRWTAPAGWHLTLAFYGEVDEERLPALRERLARAAAHTEPFALSLAGAGQFGRGRAVWAGVQGDVRDLGFLASRAEAAARRAGLRMDEHRRYRPHLSLARSGRGAPPPDVRPVLEALDGYRGRTWPVEELALVHSRLPRSGVPGEQPRYETAARWRLGASG
ncbi:RNA 2',3'-cyclic phosphodiesterase [Streptomyces fragilis]|uniref:RNA 2',3'-cyclic phosphodiesterase n=1 Tax=Streptomyces fragilis TaxID=67301 RepID=A0ABV2YCU7_9ACTN|nr:RNA 2',3'-cyclic phosphodiesterase [Streptomyces fragilis]